MLVHPAFFPQNEKFVEKAGQKYGTTQQYLLTHGPYELKDWNGTGNTWKEKKKQTVWNEQNVHIDTIHGTVVKDPTTALNLYTSNKLDIALLSGEQAATEQNMSGYTPLKTSDTFYLELNEKKELFLQNTQIRLAVSMDIHRTEYIQKVLNDTYIAAKHVTQTGLFEQNGQDLDQAAK